MATPGDYISVGMDRKVRYNLRRRGATGVGRFAFFCQVNGASEG